MSFLCSLGQAFVYAGVAVYCLGKAGVLLDDALDYAWFDLYGSQKQEPFFVVVPDCCGGRTASKDSDEEDEAPEIEIESKRTRTEQQE